VGKRSKIKEGASKHKFENDKKPTEGKRRGKRKGGFSKDGIFVDGTRPGGVHLKAVKERNFLHVIPR